MPYSEVALWVNSFGSSSFYIKRNKTCIERVYLLSVIYALNMQYLYAEYTPQDILDSSSI